MNNISNILKEDFEIILNMSCIKWELLANKTILITGASGLIGSNIINTIIYANETRKCNIKVIAVVRNIEKALKKLFVWQFNKEKRWISTPFAEARNVNYNKSGNSKTITTNNITLLTSDIEDFKEVDGDIDYIIHAANPTSSKFFVHNPVETINSAIIGTKNLLEIAKYKKVKSFVFLSSMEVYGSPKKGEIVKENFVLGFDSLKTRNCYPLSKKLCESLCNAYFSEYEVPIKIVRLTQTFGPGVEYDDGRIFAELMRCAVEKRDIVLKSKGETERCYLYTADAVSAILTILLNGKNGEAYNAANPGTYCSIAEMAELVANQVANNSIKVTYQIEDTQNLGYADTLFMNLGIEKLKNLGYFPSQPLKSMFERMIEYCLDN